MITPIVNIILDIFFKSDGMGMFGAALATSISYFMCFLLFCGFCVQKRIKTEVRHFILNP
jgi:Na+-driven multidrug efflux pump